MLQRQQQVGRLPRLVIVMGVSGCGKTAIASKTASALNARFIEGDALHAPSNREKMQSGIALTDEDRAPWLDRIGQSLHHNNATTIATCSALKRNYRKRLAQQAGEPVFFIYLKGDHALFAERMAKRTNHFMPASLLDSQFQALEEPAEDEWHITLPANGSAQALVAAAISAIKGR